MSADKHFNQHGVVPKPLDDYKPDDMSSARTMAVLIITLLVVCTVITAIIYGRTDRQMNQEAAPIEHTMVQ